ncbi:5-methylcytosine-specific restriction enzyme subunit McrC [Rhodococcus sp. LBL1]|nr:5-methylcytosine-specific restriction enzyme subunit McrC [Rhodococcus sp. LBL1]MDH6684682.1 5-methylcytosine-specific restriction enzyme subunit McrC [Rhodococcus sp. LBL2]
MTEAVELVEYQQRIIESPTPSQRDRDRIVAALGGRLVVNWLANDRVSVEATSHIGVVELPGGPRITVRPKLAGGSLNVLRMLALTSELPPDSLSDLMRRIDASEDGDLHELICRIFCAEVSAVLARGARRDYRSHSSDVGAVRGRIDVRRQALHHFGRVDTIACQYQEFDHDVPDNRILRVAVDLVRRTVRRPDTRLQAAALHEELTDLAPGRAPSPDQFRRTRIYDRQNEHYRIAHHWALVLLDVQRVDDLFQSEGARVGAFLLDMNRLFEDFLAWLVGAAFRSDRVAVTPQTRDRTLITVDSKQYGTVIPDLLVRVGDRRLAVDAKYKRYDKRSIAPSDIYQLLVYAQGYPGFSDAPTSVLVFPTEDEMVLFRVDLTPGSSRVASVQCLGLQLPQLLHHIGSDGSLDDPHVQLQLRRLAYAMGL